jgi:hypothetical protein
MPSHSAPTRRPTTMTSDPGSASTVLGESNASKLDEMAQGDAVDAAGGAEHSPPPQGIPPALMQLVPPDISGDESSYLVLAYLEFRAAVHRDPTVPEFQAVLDRWDAGPGAAATHEVSQWIDALAALEPALAAGGTLPATTIGALRDEVAMLPKALQGPWYLKLHAAAAYDNQRDNDIAKEGDGGGTCNVTALGMALQGMGFDADAESLYQGLDKTDQADPYGHMKDAVETATQGADTLWMIACKNDKPEFWTGPVNALLEHGYGVLVHVYGQDAEGKQSGHVVRLQGVTPNGLVIDDPYGRESVGAGGVRHVDEYNHRRDGDKRKDDAGNDNLWAFDEFLGVRDGPMDIRFIAPDPLPADIAGSVAKDGRVTGGVLDGRKVTN